MAAQPVSEKDWQTEQDANMLIQAEEIKKDKTRLKKARAYLKKKLAATQAASKAS